VIVLGYTKQSIHLIIVCIHSLNNFIFSLPFFKIIVPTIDTVRYNYLVEAFLSKKRPVLLVGPVGTGKTLTVQKALEVMDKNKFLNLTINMSAQTTVHNVQENIEGRLEKRTKDTYVPLSSTLS